MNRELDFRIWVWKKFYYSQGHFLCHAEHSNEFCLSFIMEPWLEHWGLRPEYVVQQYTGLKDKNGNKIYEGDIIKESYDRIMGYVANFDKEKTDINDGKWTYGDFSYTSIVIWNEQYHSFGVTRYLDGGDRDKAQMFPLNGENIEIIGNIFENLELIK